MSTPIPSPVLLSTDLREQIDRARSVAFVTKVCVAVAAAALVVALVAAALAWLGQPDPSFGELDTPWASTAAAATAVAVVPSGEPFADVLEVMIQSGMTFGPPMAIAMVLISMGLAIVRMEPMRVVVAFVVAAPLILMPQIAKHLLLQPDAAMDAASQAHTDWERAYLKAQVAVRAGDAASGRADVERMLLLEASDEADEQVIYAVEVATHGAPRSTRAQAYAAEAAAWHTRTAEVARIATIILLGMSALAAWLGVTAHQMLKRVEQRIGRFPVPVRLFG